MLKIGLLFLGAIVAFWISAICGGGASLILIPVLNILLPTSVVPLSLTVGTFTSSASRIAVFKKFINWRIFFWFVPFSIPAVLFGAYLIKFVNPVYLQLVVGFILIANVPQLFITRKKQEKTEKPYPEFVLAIVGFFAGFVSGITGAIGLLFNRFYLKYGLSKEEIVATRAANEIFLHLIKLIIYIILGLYSTTAIWLGIAIAIATIISSYTVKYILPYLSEFVFRKIGYGAMVISGVSLLISTSGKIIQQDNLDIFKNKFGETAIKWRESSFVLEFAIDDGLEIEKPILSDELPKNINEKYTELISKYDTIYLEKVFKLGSESSYEFYCYKNNRLTKFEFK
ncbi:sulfite exporter TauE/SafE family protein [Riemerella anatipestifer]|uniref:sulfite exporter TauE/SafE family protein n=1 Tax=Riemerella anatipestifer TaxID=34085 RepID=UPI00129DC541|nr:sulfite exporter TauE/SafE family protein [Riemerella anatipestifer]